jgi:uncharacterized protein (DUF427 family)
MRAIWNNQIIAESDQTIYIEGNQYFPPESVKKEFLTDSGTHTTCPWKGEASYFSIVVDGQENTDAAWYYPTPKPRAIEIVKQDFSNYVAFWRGVTVEQ